MTALDSALIEDIVHGRKPAPASHRNLTLERQLAYLERAILQAQLLVPADAVARVEEVARDAKGTPLLDKDGMPKIIERKLFRRELAGAEHKLQRAQLQATYRRRLAKSNAEHSRDAEELHRAITGEFGERPSSEDRAEVEAFKRQFQAQHGHFVG